MILATGALEVLGVAGGLLVVAWAVHRATRAAPGRGVAPGGSEFLCDTCLYSDPRHCSRPERPNATECSDYRGPGAA